MHNLEGNCLLKLDFPYASFPAGLDREGIANGMIVNALPTV